MWPVLHDTPVPHDVLHRLDVKRSRTLFRLQIEWKLGPRLKHWPSAVILPLYPA